MNKTIGQVLSRFQALSTRERLMALGAGIAILYFLTDLALLSPPQRAAKALRQQIERQQKELVELNRAVAELSSGSQADGLASLRAERDELRARVGEAEAVIGRASAEVRLGEVIRTMVGATPGLTLVSLRTLPVEPFLHGGAAPRAGAGPGAPAASGPAPALYKHGIEVAVKGRYLVLLSWLQGLERGPNRLFWSSLRLEVTTYPDATLKLTVYALSERSDSPLG